MLGFIGFRFFAKDFLTHVEESVLVNFINIALGILLAWVTYYLCYKSGAVRAAVSAVIPLLINIAICFLKPGNFIAFLFGLSISIIFWQFARGKFNMTECFIIFLIGVLIALILWKFPSTGNIGTFLWISDVGLMVFGFLGAVDPPERYKP